MEVVDLPNNESLLRSDQDGQDQEEHHRVIWRELEGDADGESPRRKMLMLELTGRRPGGHEVSWCERRRYGELDGARKCRRIRQRLVS